MRNFCLTKKNKTMKKTYISPTMIVVRIKPRQMLTTSPGAGLGINNSDATIDEFDEYDD